MKQEFLEVWKDGQLWYEFPAENENNTREHLMKIGLDRVCEIRAKVKDPIILKEAIKQQETIVNLNEDKPKVGRPKKQ